MAKEKPWLFEPWFFLYGRAGIRALQLAIYNTCTGVTSAYSAIFRYLRSKKDICIHERDFAESKEFSYNRVYRCYKIWCRLNILKERKEHSTIMLTLPELICLFLNKCFPKTKVIGRESPQSYSEAEYRSAKWGLELYASHINLKDKDILDAGCGLGGKTVFYAENGCNSIVGIDMDENHIDYSSQFAMRKMVFNAHFKQANLVSLPFESNSFDVIFLNDVIEHIRRPFLINALEECKRVLRQDGRICLEFPPWSSWNAAHLFDYIYIPWCQLFFSDKTLLNVLRRMDLKPRFGKLSYIEHFQELNRITVEEFINIAKKLDFKIIYSELRMLKNKKSLKRIPYLNKYLISHFIAVLSK